MNSRYSDWAKLHSRRITPEELATEFRELQREGHVAGWRRNIAFLTIGALFGLAVVMWRFHH